MKYAVIGYVEKAFHQIQLNEIDCTWFLWLKKLEKEANDKNLIILHFKLVSFEVSLSPFLSPTTTEKHLKETNSPLLATILWNLGRRRASNSNLQGNEKKLFREAGIHELKDASSRQTDSVSTRIHFTTRYLIH